MEIMEKNITLDNKKHRRKTSGPHEIWSAFILIAILAAICPINIGHAATGTIYFKNTDHQLEVIKLKGKKPGLTVLIFGGIHGDEPGGYFSSEILSDIQLHKGNLIIVPRVNFPSIMLNKREIHGDMNRKFVPHDEPDDPDIEVVRLLKGLMKEADVFINQHDAYGFHRETYISEKYNQSRYGQSLIIDASKFYSEKLREEVHLSAIGKRILKRVNQQIENPDHHFGFWDHDSLAKNTKHPEMKRSATYYALTTYSIPAFGLETSKDLPTLYHKIKYQLVVLKEILHEFQLEFDFPEIKFKEPVLYWVELLKNGNEIIRVNGNTNLRLNPGDTISIKNIFSNVESGLSANILNWGSINDMNKEFTFNSNATIHIKKNHLTIGKIYLRNYRPNSVKEIEIDVNGRHKTIPNWGKIEISSGQYFKILTTKPAFSSIRFDVRGYSPAKGKKGDANVQIRPEQLITKYSFEKKGTIYFVKVYTNNTFAGGFQVEYTQQ